MRDERRPRPPRAADQPRCGQKRQRDVEEEIGEEELEQRRVGGRRELVIPPRLAYGENGRHQLSGKTLIFVIDLLNVR